MDLGVLEREVIGQEAALRKKRCCVICLEEKLLSLLKT